MAKIHSLKRFYCHHNVMFDDEKFIRELKNGAKNSTSRYEVNPEAKFDEKIDLSTANKASKSQMGAISLSLMCNLIEKVNSVPSQSQRYLTELNKISNDIKENLELAEQNFNKSNQAEDNDLIEYFIQNAEMIAETESNCQENIVMILINLGHLNSNKFGSKCFVALQDLMSSSKEGDIFNIIKDKLKEHVIDKFKAEVKNEGSDGRELKLNSNLPVLKGLCHIIEKSECNEILSKLYEGGENGVFLSWLSEMVEEKVIDDPDNFRAQSLMDKRMEEVYKWRIGLISISLRNSDKNIKEFSNNSKMKNYIVQIFNKAKPVDERYIFLLRIIQYTSENNKSIATEYLAKYIDEKFKYRIRDKLIIYKKFEALSENEEEERNKTEADKQLEYKILAAQIDCLAGLLTSESAEMDKFLQNKVHEEILSILSLYQVDPLLLLSCCNYAKKYFSHPEVIENTILLPMSLPKIDS